MQNNYCSKKQIKSISEEKCIEKNKFSKRIKYMIEFIENRRSTHKIIFFLIKYFSIHNFKLASINDLNQYVLKIFKLNCEHLITSHNTLYKDKKSIIISILKFINKHNIFISHSNNKYELNQREALNYLQSQTNLHTNRNASPSSPVRKKSFSNNFNVLIKSPVSPVKSNKINILNNSSKINDSNKKEKIDFSNYMKKKYEKENLKKIIENKEVTPKIKKEIIILKNENKINKEGAKIKPDNDDAHENSRKEKDIFNSVLYNNFYFSLVEEGLFEQLQEKIENLIENYNENKIDDCNKFNVYGNINKIREIKSYIDELNEMKQKYNKYISELETQIKYLKFYYKLIKLNYNGMELAQKLKVSTDFQIDKDSKSMYIFSKSKHDEIYLNIVNLIYEMRSIFQSSKEIKNNILKIFFGLFDYFKDNNIKLEDNDDIYDLIYNFKRLKYPINNKENFIKEIIQKYNKKIRDFEEKLKNEKLIV